MEATACLVDVTDFKSDEGAKAPWRVRFPSASAEDDQQHTTGDLRLFVVSRVPVVIATRLCR
jgi:hypothetical protein